MNIYLSGVGEKTTSMTPKAEFKMINRYEFKNVTNYQCPHNKNQILKFLNVLSR